MSFRMFLFAIALIAVASAAAKWGGRAERVAGVMYLVAAIATVIVRSPSPDRYLHLQVGVLIVDAALLIGLCWIVLKEDRWWTIASAAMQLLTLLGHMAKIVDPAIGRMAYFTTIVGSSLPSLMLLAIGTANHAKRAGGRRRSASSIDTACGTRSER